tara:strand:- start:568 stop:870 length:303 start_codon:yes stop_codon:yes gene_type:complete
MKTLLALLLLIPSLSWGDKILLCDSDYIWKLSEGNQYLEDVQGEFIYDFVEESEIYLQFIDYTSGKEVIILLNKYTLDLTSYVDKVEYHNGKCEIIEKQL